MWLSSGSSDSSLLKLEHTFDHCYQTRCFILGQILGYGALARLVKMGYATSAEEATKALYAISALVRDNINGQEAFHSENGSAMLQVVKTWS